MIYVLSSLSFSLLLQIFLIWKCKIRKRDALWSGIGIGVSSCIISWTLHSYFPSSSVLFLINGFIVLGLTFSWILFRFYRDPERKIPNQKGMIVSPADGRIRYMVQVKKGQIGFSSKGNKRIPFSDVIPSTPFNSQDFMLIGIEMNLLDVHVNRAPISGRIVYLKHIPGKFLSLRGCTFLTQNERLFTMIENEKIHIGMLQIASRLVRRIVCYRKLGQVVECGERIGMIRFGSQVDVLIPLREDIRFYVAPGNYVKAGESILARYSHP